MFPKDKSAAAGLEQGTMRSIALCVTTSPSHLHIYVCIHRWFDHTCSSHICSFVHFQHLPNSEHQTCTKHSGILLSQETMEFTPMKSVFTCISCWGCTFVFWKATLGLNTWPNHNPNSNLHPSLTYDPTLTLHLWWNKEWSKCRWSKCLYSKYYWSLSHWSNWQVTKQKREIITTLLLTCA